MYSKDCEYINNLFKANSISTVWNGNNCCNMEWGPSKTRKRAIEVNDFSNDNDTQFNNEIRNSFFINYSNNNYDNHNNSIYNNNDSNRYNYNNIELGKREETWINRVVCNVTRNEAKIISIQLQGNHDFKIKSETFPKEFGQLSELKSLFLSKHKIKELSPSIGTMENLEQLVLTNNDIQGKIPIEIGRLQHLVKLNLSGNKLKGPIPDSISDLTGLTDIQLDKNHLEGTIPDPLLTLPLNTCALNNNKRLCLSDNAKLWQSQCKNSVPEYCSDSSGLGKIGFVVLLLVLLFISVLVIFCIIYYRRNGHTIGNIKWTFFQKNKFFHNDSYATPYSNYSQSKLDSSYKMNSSFIPYYPSTKFNRSPKKKNYPEDEPVPSNLPYPSFPLKYLPSTAGSFAYGPSSLDRNKTKSSSKSKISLHNYAHYNDGQDHDHYYPHDPMEPPMSIPNHNHNINHINSTNNINNNNNYPNINSNPNNKNEKYRKDRHDFNNNNNYDPPYPYYNDYDNHSPQYKGNLNPPMNPMNSNNINKNNNNINPFNTKYSKNHYSLNTVESDKAQWTDSEIDQYLYSNLFKKKSFSKPKIVVPIRNIFHSKYNNNNNNNNNNKLLPPEPLHTNPNYPYRNTNNNSNDNNMNGNRKGSHLSSKKTYDKDLPVPKEFKKMRSHSRHPSLNNTHIYPNSLHNSTVNPNINSNHNMKHHSKKINFFPDMVPNYDYDSDDSLESLSSGLPPPVRTSLQSLSNDSTYLHSSYDRRNTLYGNNKIMDNQQQQQLPPLLPTQSPQQSPYNPYMDGNSSRKKNSSYYEHNSHNPVNYYSNDPNSNINKASSKKSNNINDTNNNNNVNNNNNNNNNNGKINSNSDTIYYVVRPYKAQRTDEISIHPGDAVNIFRSFDDGWAEGLNRATNRIGMFPLNFVQLSGSYQSDPRSKNKNDSYNGGGQGPGTGNSPSMDMDNTKLLLFRQKIAEVDTLRKLLNDPTLSEERRRKCYSRLKKIESAFN